MSDAAVTGGDVLAARARAKVNPRLRVFPRDDSGFHGLETIFLALELADVVRIRFGGSGTTLRLDLGEDVPPGSVPEGPDNLCLRAVEAFRGAARDGGRRGPGGLTVHLEKRIPAGAGLGGGSADAAAVLRLLNARLDRPLDGAALARVAGRLGSDVPFALTGVAAALGWGRGDRLLPLDPPPARPALVALPGVGVSTPDAYRWVDEDRAAGAGGAPESWPGGAVLPAAGALGRWDTLASLAANDFEGPVFRRHPPLSALRERLASGALVARLAGSGGAVFGVYPDEESRDRAAARVVEETGVPVRRTRTAAARAWSGAPWPLV